MLLHMVVHDKKASNKSNEKKNKTSQMSKEEPQIYFNSGHKSLSVVIEFLQITN